MSLIRSLAALASLLVSASSTRAADDLPLELDHRGIVRSIADGPREQAIGGNLIVYQAGWSKVTQLWDVNVDTRRNAIDDADKLIWHTTAGTLPLKGGGTLKVRQQVRADADGSTRVRLIVEAPQGVPDADAVEYLIGLPVADFAGATFLVETRSGEARSPTILPVRFGGKDLRDRDRAERFSVESKRTTLTGTFELPTRVRLQDARAFKADAYQVCLSLGAGPVAPGATLSLALSLKATIARDDGVSTVTIDAGKPKQAFDGFGGNYVYGVHSDMVERTRLALRPAWVRIGAELAAWQPLESNVVDTRPTGPRREVLDVSRRLQLGARAGLAGDRPRVILSAWRLPEWLYAPAPGVPDDAPRSVPESRWPELARCIGSYVAYLQTDWVSIDLFSFNESDLGVYVKLDADQTRKLTILLGQEFERRKLPTKVMLGDSAMARAGIEQIAPTLADPEAMKHVGALAYHAWAEEKDAWPAWRDAAARAKVPLLVTEVGADAEAWKDGSFRGPRYFIREARRFVDLMNESGAVALLQWEWSDDYALLDPKRLNEPTARFGSMQQFANTVPKGNVVTTTSDHASVVASALVGKDGQWTVHVVNVADARKVRLRNLPAGACRVMLTTVDGPVLQPAPLRPSDDGRDVEYDVPARSHLTITSMRGEGQGERGERTPSR